MQQTRGSKQPDPNTSHTHTLIVCVIIPFGSESCAHQKFLGPLELPSKKHYLNFLSPAGGGETEGTEGW